ncbi:response regulator [Massilia sp. METH4]|uniref:response regulator n=1 Tax=Massilia sp. METH4 TaxID=3123041 RepID=UPI0030CC51AC
MLKAVIIDGSAVARGLLNTVLVDGGYDVVGQAHTCAAGTALLIKFNPQIVCINRDQVEQDVAGVEAMRKQWPKALIFMMSSEFDAATVQRAHAMGVNGFIVKPFNGGTVLKTIRNTVLAMVKRQQKAQAENGGEPAAEE